MASQMSSQVQEASSSGKDLFILGSRQPGVIKNVILMVVNSGQTERKTNKEGESDSSRFIASC
jgi:hypothetical protein